MLEQIVTGQLARNSSDFNEATAQALFKRQLLDANFSVTELGRNVAAEIISRKPKQYAQPELARLIEGLEILQKYEPNARPYTTQRSGRCIVLQEEAFIEITQPDMMLLEDIGWEHSACLMWTF